MRWVLIGLLVPIVLTYIGGPLLIYFTQKLEGRPNFSELDETNLPEPVTRFLYETVEEVRKEGFVAEAFLMADTAMNISAYLVMMANRETGDKAMVTALVAAGGAQVVPYVEYSTRYRSGKSVDTLNSDTISSFEPTANEYKTQLFTVKEPRTLYRIHRHVLQRHAEIGFNDEKVLYPHGEALAYLLQVMEEGYEEQVKTGLLRREGSGDSLIYRPTPIGAFKMTYRLLPPFAASVRKRVQEHADRILRSYKEEQGYAA
ncbi:MAG: hypothetical protein OHK0029_37960 [Armatimonadaceae bacterium]